jgi:hypothetical protein
VRCIRLAVEVFLDNTPPADSKPAERVVHLLGSLTSGVPDLAGRAARREHVLGDDLP